MKVQQALVQAFGLPVPLVVGPDDSRAGTTTKIGGRIAVRVVALAALAATVTPGGGEESHEAIGAPPRRSTDGRCVALASRSEPVGERAKVVHRPASQVRVGPADVGRPSPGQAAREVNTSPALAHWRLGRYPSCTGSAAACTSSGSRYSGSSVSSASPARSAPGNAASSASSLRSSASNRA